MTVHYTDKYLLNPQHLITVNLVGLGGTGSQMLSSLARIHLALRALDHPGLHVRAWDPDEVAAANIGRQLFSKVDIGANKAIVLVSRVNRALGLNWEAYPKAFNNNPRANILITCIDTAAGRVDISGMMKPIKGGEPYARPIYWLDLGNLQKTGQVIMGTVGKIGQPKTEDRTTGLLKNVVEKFPSIKKIKEKDQGPSCSLAEALGKQDLFINSALVQFGGALIWKLFREGRIKHHGCFVNLDNFQVTPIPIK